MAKLILIADTHFGVRKGSYDFHHNMKLFYDNIFFPYLNEHMMEIDGIIHLGDVYHDRRKIDTFTMRASREYFFTPLQKFLEKRQIYMDVILGNHDIFYRNDMGTNSLNEFVQRQDFGGTGYSGIRTHSDFTEIKDWNLCLIPWITSKNREEITNSIARSKARFALGHLELTGFNFSKSQVALHGEDPNTFKDFELVLSGHYHYPHKKDNIQYLGSPTEQTWIDEGDKRGFYVFDTDTGEIELIENPYNIFKKVRIGEITDELKNHPQFYRLYHDKDVQRSQIDLAISQLKDSYGALDIQVVVDNNNQADLTVSSRSNTIDNVEDTPTVIRNYIDDEEIANILISLYNEAQNEG